MRFNRMLFNRNLPSSDFDTQYVYDVFHNDEKKLVIIMPAECDPPRIEYVCSKFNLLFELHVCPHNHTFIYELKLETEYAENIELRINDKIFSVNVSKYPEFRNEIIMSTIVLNEDDYIRQWIKYHMNIGVSRFIIYDNSKNNESNLTQVLGDFIEKEIVVLIEWPYPYALPKSSLSGQTTQQNHSIYAFRTSKYIGLFDVDEYVNMQTHTNLNSCFDSLIAQNGINTNDIGSFRLLNKFFVNPDNLPTTRYDFLSIFSCAEITLDGHEKNFVIPTNVHTFSVHMITSGKPMYCIDFNTIYFNHYVFLNKSPTSSNRHTNGMNIYLQDNTILKHCDFITDP